MATIGGIVPSGGGVGVILSVLPAQRGAEQVVVRQVSGQAPPNARDVPGAAPQSPEQAFSRTDLSPAERRRLEELQRTDSAVRNEEQTHAAVAGRYGGPPQYETQTGPDGRQYRVAGRVNVASDGTAEANDRLQAAATAVRSPSSADYGVAAQSADPVAAYRAADERVRPGLLVDAQA